MLFRSEVPLATIVRAMTEGPCAAFGLERPALRAGAPANLALWDLEQEWVVGDRPFRSKSGNSCFLGRRVQGRYVATGFIPKFVEQIEAKGLKIPRSLFTTK